MDRLAYYCILAWIFIVCTTLSKGIRADSDEQGKRHLTVQNYMLIWLSPPMNASDHQYLQEIFNTIYTFNQVSDCVDFVDQIEDERVFLILSDDLLDSTMSTIHNRTQLHSFYVLARRGATNEQWKQQWPKIRGLFTDVDALVDALKQDTQQCDRDSVSFSVTTGKSLDRLNSMFTYACLLKKFLIETKNNRNVRKELAALARNHYVHNADELKRIDAFERNYRLDTAIWWYTQKCFLYQMLNRALRTHEIEVLIKMGFFLRDIQQQIDELRSDRVRNGNIILIYRGQGISNVDLERIKRTRKGDLLVFNSFLTASLNKKTALQMAHNSMHHPDMIGVLFNISVNTSASAMPFVSRRQVDALANEKEGILFSINPIFRIADLKPLEKRLWEIELTVVRDDDPQLAQLQARLQKETFKLSRWERLGDLLIRMKHFDKAEDVYQMVLRSASDADSKTLPYIYNQLGRIKDKQQAFTEALGYHQKALDIQQKYFSSNHLELTHTYNHFGSVYNNMGEYAKALDFYGKTLEIQQDLLPPNHQQFMTTYKNFGSVYQNMQEYSQALEFYQKVLHIQEKSLESDHGDFISTYHSIASLHHNMSEYANALLFYERMLKIYQKSFPANYPYLVVLYQTIGTVHQAMEQYPKALKYFQKSLKIQQESLPSDDPSLLENYRNVASVYYEMKNYSKALEFFHKTLDIQRKSLPPNHPDLAVTYDYLGLAHQHLKQDSKAASFFERAIDIAQQTQPSNHTTLEAFQKHLRSLRDEL